MPNFRYRALTQNGEIVHGTLSAPTASEVARRIEYLRLLPIETVEDKKRGAGAGRLRLVRPAECGGGDDLHAGPGAAAEGRRAARRRARTARQRCRCRPAAAGGRQACAHALLAGESFAERGCGHPALFPPMYVALVRVGEVSGTLDQVLEMLGAERARSEAMRRKLTDAMQYPAFVLIAAVCVMLFFILFVLPQFSSVLQDFGAKSDTALSVFIRLSEFLRANATPVAARRRRRRLQAAWWLLRRPGTAQRDRVVRRANCPASPASFSSIAPACSAGISASCSAAASISPRPCAFWSTSWR